MKSVVRFAGKSVKRAFGKSLLFSIFIFESLELTKLQFRRCKKHFLSVKFNQMKIITKEKKYNTEPQKAQHDEGDFAQTLKCISFELHACPVS